MSGAILYSLYMPSLPREGKLQLSYLLNFHFKFSMGIQLVGLPATLFKYKSFVWP